MVPNTPDKLAQWLVRLKLVAPQPMDDCLAEIGPRHAEIGELLSLLERRNLLTPFQTGQIRKGDDDTLVLGDHKLLYRNASGSFARVFRAESLSTGKMVALKLLRQRWSKDPHTVSQFRREAELCKRLRHKNIVPIYDLGKQGNHHFFTLEFVEGGNLKDFITIRRKVSPKEATQCILDMAEGLEYALRMGITHRDLKLTNVLMSTDGVAKLVDFGLAGNDGVIGSDEDEASQRALEYAALEKGTGVPDNDPRSDLFFLGAIYYELLTGVPPYPRTRNREERKRLSRYSHVRALRSVDPGLPLSVVSIVEKLMSVSPAERYQSATELIGHLRPVLQEFHGSDTTVADGSSLGSTNSGAPSVLCIEDRPKHQDVLRTYLSKHGYRVLLLGDLQRALNRLRTNPPDCVVLIGESIGDPIVSAFHQTMQIGRTRPVSAVAVLSKKQTHMKDDFKESGSMRVLTQPVTLRELRKEIQRVLRRPDQSTFPPPTDDTDADDSMFMHV